ncbi:MFS transporter [Novosphingobium sp. JCM 18896]|uniref:MFS transporter n=1 Tax=Novosphingobium sp. JCM 18896 TaxID=2989731 RepID=UPI0022220242|nr:MFS transporter [Novosphingobium sp. JCM 18896]MCW1432332.1 MFS transporter [Novosphingobium sp. JCM 18896]
MPSTTSGNRLLTWLCLGVAVLEGFELQMAGVAASHIAADLGLDIETLGLFFSSSTFGLLIGALLGGWLADRFGRIEVLSGSVIAFGLASVLTALATDATMLICVRALTGAGLGGALPNLLALTSETAQQGREKRAVAYLYSGVPLGGIAVSLIGAALGSRWQLLFVAGGIPPLLVGALIWFERGPRTMITAGDTSTSPVDALFGGGRAFATILLWTAFCTTLVILYLVLNWLPTVLRGMSFTPLQALAAQVAFNLGGFFACLASAPLLDGKRILPVAIVSFVSIPLVLLGLSHSTSLGLTFFIALLLGGSVLTTQSLLYAIAPTVYPAGMRGVGTGGAVAWGRIGSIAGPLYGGLLISSEGSMRDAVTGTVPVAIAAGAAAVLLVIRLRAVGTVEDATEARPH